MERIKGKFDDTENKIRPGATWVSGFTLPGNNDDVRAVDSDGAEMHLIPASRYYASCEIKRGQAVSIAQLNDLTEKQKANKYAYVKITDPDIDDSCLGIAMNYAREGQIVQIQNKGKFNYYTTDSLLNTAERRKHEIFLNADGWVFDEVRGQKLYIKKIYGDATNSGRLITGDESNYDSANEVLLDENGDAFDTSHSDESKSADTYSAFTYDFYDSIYNVRNTIQIGYLTDAPTTDDSRGGLTKVVKDGFTSFVDSDGNVLTRAVVVEKTEDEKIRIVEGSTDADRETAEEGNRWWKKLADADRLPKAHEAVWLQKFRKLVDEEYVDYYTPVDDKVVTIELDVTGDTRGPVDNTQFILTLGENIYFNTYKHDVDYNELDENGNLVHAPNFNTGIYDELKVVAIAQGSPTGPHFRIFTKSATHVDDTELEQGFIGIRKLDGDTYIVPLLTKKSVDTFKKDTMEALTDPNDEGYYKLSKQFTNSTEHDYTLPDGSTQSRSPEIFFTEPLNVLDTEHLKQIFSDVLQKIFVDEDSLVAGCETKINEIGDNGFAITTDKNGGYYDVYVSQDALAYISVTVVDHGQTAKAGEAILADIRDRDRLSIAGLVLSNQTGVRKKGETIKVMRIGRVVTLGNMQTGAEYYLGLNGRITTRAQYWYDHNVPIGIAESPNYLLVDISQVPLHSYSGNFPLGYIKPSIYGQAEKGFVLADGYTVYSKSEYPELYNLLLNWYDESDLDPSNVTEAVFTKATSSEVAGVFSDVFKALQDMQLQNALLQANVATRVSSVESANASQDTRITAIEKLNSKQNARLESAESRLSSIESLDETQQARLSSIEKTDAEQSSKLASIEKTDEKQAAEIEALQAKNVAQDEALAVSEAAQDEKLSTYKKEQAEADAAQNKAFEDYKAEQKLVDEAQVTKASLATEIAALNEAIASALNSAKEDAANKDEEQTEAIRTAVTAEITAAIADFVTEATLEAYKTAQEARVSAIESTDTEQSKKLEEIETKNKEQDEAIEAAEETQEIEDRFAEIEKAIDSKLAEAALSKDVEELNEKLDEANTVIETLKKLVIAVAPTLTITASVNGIPIESNLNVWDEAINPSLVVLLTVDDAASETGEWSGGVKNVSEDNKTAVAIPDAEPVLYTNTLTGKIAQYELISLKVATLPVVRDSTLAEGSYSTLEGKAGDICNLMIDKAEYTGNFKSCTVQIDIAGTSTIENLRYMPANSVTYVSASELGEENYRQQETKTTLTFDYDNCPKKIEFTGASSGDQTVTVNFKAVDAIGIEKVDSSVQSYEFLRSILAKEINWVSEADKTNLAKNVALKQPDGANAEYNKYYTSLYLEPVTAVPEIQESDKLVWVASDASTIYLRTSFIVEIVEDKIIRSSRRHFVDDLDTIYRDTLLAYYEDPKDEVAENAKLSAVLDAIVAYGLTEDESVALGLAVDKNVDRTALQELYTVKDAFETTKRELELEAEVEAETKGLEIGSYEYYNFVNAYVTAAKSASNGKFKSMLEDCIKDQLIQERKLSYLAGTHDGGTVPVPMDSESGAHSLVYSLYEQEENPSSTTSIAYYKRASTTLDVSA